MSLPAQSWWTSFSRYTFVNTGRKSSSDDSESTQALQRTTKLTSTVLTATTDGHPSSSTPLLNPTVTVEISTPETRERQMPLSMSLLSPSVFVAKTSASGATSPNPEMIPESGPAAAELAGLYSSVMGSPPQPGPSTNGTLDKIGGFPNTAFIPNTLTPLPRGRICRCKGLHCTIRTHRQNCRRRCWTNYYRQV